LVHMPTKWTDTMTQPNNSKGTLLPPPEHIRYYTFLLLNSHFLQNTYKNSNSYCTSPKTYQYKN